MISDKADGAVRGYEWRGDSAVWIVYALLSALEGLIQP